MTSFVTAGYRPRATIRSFEEDAMTRRHAAAVALLLFLALPRATAQATRPPTIDDVLDLVQVSAPRISPDGSRVLFSRTDLKKWKDNKRVPSIWIVNADGTNAYQFLSSDKDRNPAWSPDGRTIAFLSSRGEPENGADRDADAGSQIWLIRAAGGEAWKLSAHKGGIRDFQWAEDGSQIFFVADQAQSDEEKAAQKAGDDAIFVDEGANGQDRGRFAELWTIPVAEAKERQITKERLIINGFDIAPDARRLAIAFRRENVRNHQYKTEIGVVDAATGALTQVTRNDAPENGVRWAPDGQSLSYLAPTNGAWDLAQDKLWIVPASGGTPRTLTTFDGDFGSYFWARDGRTIRFEASRRGRQGVYQLDVATGAVTPILTGDRAAGLASVSRDGTRGAAVISTPTTPGDVHVVDLRAGSSARVTDVNPHVRAMTLAQWRAVTWKSKDGTEIEGLLWLPADYKAGARLPLILSVHGGPAGVWSASFRGINHVYASLGWAILEPNVRGSTSYGDALLRGNMKDIGGGDYEDLMTGVDALVAQGLADPAQLAIRGWSYGGILGGWTITQTPRFKAASLGAMVSDWSSEYAMGFNHDVRLWYITGTPWENADAYRRQSSYTHIAKVTTPTLVLHGERDTTDTIGQSMMFYQGLKDRGVPVRFIRFPREPHGFREPHHQRVRDTEEIAWLMKHARGIDWKIPERKDEDASKKSTTNEGSK
jgi:dipeptidyl aminopeptidase/acylaminoacyl peptidase